MERQHALGRACSLMGALLAGLGTAWAQTPVPPSGPLYQIWDSMQVHFDSLRAVLPDSVFYAEGGEYNHFQRWFRHWEPRLAPHGDFAVYDLMMEAYRDAKFNDASSFKSNNDPWLELGPKRRRNNMIGIGPIRSITISDDDPDHMLCTSSSGGLFYTTNAADEWHNAGTDLGWPHSGCQFAAYYPDKLDHWFALSAYEKSKGRNRISKVGGVYRTFDEGGDWKLIADYMVLGGAEEGPDTEVVKLLFDRKLNTTTNDHRLFLATSRGLYLSDDPASGTPSWTQVSLSTSSPGIIIPPGIVSEYPGYTVDDGVWVHDIEYLPYDSQDPTSTLCAAMRFTLRSGNNEVKVWRFMLSDDNGDTWNEIASQPAINTAIQWATVETSAAAPTSFYCHAQLSGLGSWVRMHDTANDSWTIMASGFPTPGFGRGHALGVDQSNPNSLIVGRGIDVDWYVDGQLIPYPYPPFPREESANSTGHDDTEDVVGDPANAGVFWIAHHGGVSKIVTNGTDRTWVDKSDGLGVAEVWSMSTSQNKPDFIALGLYHDGNTITRTPYSGSWDPDWAYLNLFGDGTLVIINHEDANVVYYARQGGLWERNDNAETSETRSAFWNVPGPYYARGALNRKKSHHLYNAMKTRIIDPNTGDILEEYIEVERSMMSGLSRTRISDFENDIEVNHPTQSNAEQFWWVRSNPANSDHLYVGLQNWHWQQRIYRTTMADHPNVQTVKESWEEVPHPRRSANGSGDQQREPAPMGIAFDPENENIIYVAYASSEFSHDPEDYTATFAKKMVFKVDVSDLNAFPIDPVTGFEKFECDGTYPCTDLTMNLPNTLMDKDCLVHEQGSDGGLYIATEFGVYFTNNKRIAAHDPQNPEDADDLANTSGWVRLGGGLPHTESQGLEINYNVNRIRVGFTGRGVWEHALHCPTAEDLNETGTYSASEFLEARNDIVSEAVVPGGLRVDYRAGTEVHLTPGFHAEAGSRFHAFIHPCDLPGNSFKPKGLPTEADRPIDRTDDRPLAGQTLELFPNPASGHLSIRCAGMEESGTAQVRLFDATGKQAMAATMRGPLLQLDVSHLNGLFMVVVDRGNERSTGRVIIN